MSRFSKLLPLSDKAFDLYSQSLGRYPLSYQELNSLVPDISSEEFRKIIDQLLEVDLMFKIESTTPEILTHYVALPPLKYILNFLDSVEASVSSIQTLMRTSLKKIFKENMSDINSIFNEFQQVKNTFFEDIIDQKQAYDEIIEKLEKIKKASELINDLKRALSSVKETLILLQERFSELIRTQFVKLFNLLSAIKNTLASKIFELTNETTSLSQIQNVIDKFFQEEINLILEDFFSSFEFLIKSEFQDVEKSINGIIDETINNLILQPFENMVEEMHRFKEDFLLLQQNTLSNFNVNIRKILEMVVFNKADLLENMEALENSVVSTLDDFVHKSIQEISESWKLKEKVIDRFLERYIKSDITKVDNIWFIKSKIKLKEEIKKIFTNSREEITLIVPNLTEFLEIEKLQNILENLKIKIASSEPHSDEIVNKFRNKEHVEYRSLKNDNLVAMKGDDSFILISIIPNYSIDLLNDIVGLGCNFKPVIDIIDPILETSWSLAKTEGIKEVIDGIPVKKKPRLSLEDLIVYVSEIKPIKYTQIDTQINEMLNSIIDDLNIITGQELSKRLQDLADYILDKVGGSLTLHNIRSKVNFFKNKLSDLSDVAKGQLLNDIESWKNKLFNIY